MNRKTFLLPAALLAVLAACASSQQTESDSSRVQTIGLYKVCPECAHGQPADKALGANYDRFVGVVAELKAWIVEHAEVPLRQSQYSRVWLVSEASMQNDDGSDKRMTTIARHITYKDFQVTLLRSGWDFSVYAQGELLHELVHELQYQSGFMKRDTCDFEIETMAYDLHRQWLLEQGATIPDTFPSPWQLFVAYPC